MMFTVYWRNKNRPGRPVTWKHIEADHADDAYDKISATLEDGCEITGVYHTYSYWYGMRLRGYSPGCQPKNGLLFVHDDPDGKYWDILSYNRELTDKEIRDYELDFIERKSV